MLLLRRDIAQQQVAGGITACCCCCWGHCGLLLTLGGTLGATAKLGPLNEQEWIRIGMHSSFLRVVFAQRQRNKSMKTKTENSEIDTGI